MAVQEYLTTWNLAHLSENFEAISLTSFLSITHNTARMYYGESFAAHHQKLCDTLRSVLYMKRVRDREIVAPRNRETVAPRDRETVAPRREEGCLLDVTSSMKNMCVSRDQPSDGTDNTTRWEALRRTKRSPVADRLGPSIKLRLGSNNKHHRRRFARRNQYRGTNNNVRRDLNPAFRRVTTDTPHNDCTFTRVPVKERLGFIESRDVRVPQRRLAF